MNSDVVAVKKSENLEGVAKIMAEKRVGSVIVVDETGNLQGIITESDVIRIISKKKGGNSLI